MKQSNKPSDSPAARINAEYEAIAARVRDAYVTLDGDNEPDIWEVLGELFTAREIAMAQDYLYPTA